MRTVDPIEVLTDRVRRHPPERYPVQHATAQFHLGQALAEADRFGEAAAALRASAAVFARAGLGVEGAKATTQLGAVLRLAGEPEPAIALLRAAAEAFADGGEAVDEGAARFNLGMALREAGGSGAHEAFARARECWERAGHLEPASAAAREAGTESWAAGVGDRAIAELTDAAELAATAGAAAAEGAAANVLGLVLLEAGRPVDARASLGEAVAAHPRSVRPADHAMAQANLALAHEQAGDALRARVAARQALSVGEAPAPVREQARDVLGRLGDPSGDLPQLLAGEPFERWPALVRSEQARLAEDEEAHRHTEAQAWLAHQLAHPEQGEELAATWLGGLLELPAESLEVLVADLITALEALGPGDADRLRREFERGMARFHPPQMLRLRDTFARLAAERGLSEWR
ncbi:MAG: hypothetical protein AVDCRST_MAG69-743 [uncultured Solirubrobacteraceae bacterium]|uniref:Tetratricopeptide repeat protein n=1 Tax=uncultured Solirubrobacteraceae bacterium TaxID=1162706 RepID=A0A6J4RRL2_9ACTN|nr:MAG: hypothetical protein AVDCRST_MAG69-743 [uncultured Solirubrobacteraceae bacterium]